MKQYLVKFEWKISDSRNANGAYRTGVSQFQIGAKSKIDAINIAIECAQHLPSWEFERNEIDMNEYRENEKSCSIYYTTTLTKIINVKEIK